MIAAVQPGAQTGITKQKITAKRTVQTGTNTSSKSTMPLLTARLTVLIACPGRLSAG